MNKGLVDKIVEVFRPQAPFWACELTTRNVVVAGVNKQRDQLKAKLTDALGSNGVSPSLNAPNIQNPALLRTTVADALSRAGFEGSEIAVVVPDDSARIAFLTVENLSRDPEEQKTFIRWKLKKSLPFDVDTAQVAFHVLGPHHGSGASIKTGSGMDLLVTLSPRPVIEEYEALFTSMELHPGLIVPSTIAALNLFRAPAGDTLFLKIAPGCITTTVFQRGRMQFYRRVADISLYDAVFPTVMYYQDKLGGKTLDQLVVCGYDSDTPSPLGEVEQELGLTAQRLEPISVDDVFKPVLGVVRLAQPEGIGVTSHG